MAKKKKSRLKDLEKDTLTAETEESVEGTEEVAEESPKTKKGKTDKKNKKSEGNQSALKGNKKYKKVEEEETDGEEEIDGEENEDAPVSPWKIVLATTVCVLLLVVLVFAIIYGVTGELPYGFGKQDTTPTVTTAPLGTAEDLGLVEGLADIDSYTVTSELLNGEPDAVIAQYGEYKLTNSLLQVFYFSEFNTLVSQCINSGYDPATYYQLDIYSPMDLQQVPGYDVTWEQLLLDAALRAWHQYAIANTMADQEGFQVSQEEAIDMDSFCQQMEEEAKADGFANAEALIDERVGVIADMEDYLAYMELVIRGDAYYAHCYSTYEPTDEEISEYFDANADTFAGNGITKESGKLISVRHVLIQPETTATDASGYPDATEEQWEACRVKAQGLLDAWVEGGATEEAFGVMATDNTTDTGSASNGGLYQNVYKGQMVEAFDAWCFDEARQPGDYGLVKTEFGYHIMYFVSRSEQDAWYVMARQNAISNAYGFNKAFDAAVEANPLAPSLELIVVSDLKRKPVEATPETTAAAEDSGVNTGTYPTVGLGN